ncbi:MAG: deoxyribonuclease IV [Planctomycetes bacterium]|nr:deoxyribonuclease IV [Planctomycetota bacterium]
MNLGSHLSIAGGLHHALEEAARLGCGALQIFTKSNTQWAARPLAAAAVKTWHDTRRATGIRAVVAHDCYLINLASPDPALRQKSIDAFRVEMERAELLGLDGLVMHPGAHLGTGEEAGLERVADAFDTLHAATPGYRLRILVETTAGMGTTLGWRFEHLAHLLRRVRAADRLGVCLDTCHVFAAGYDFRTPAGYRKVMREFERRVGRDRICAFHLNDSKGECGSRLDRHEHIGRGKLGLEAFRPLLNDRRFRDVPMILETPKEEDMDRVNLAALRGLRARATPTARARTRVT